MEKVSFRAQFTRRVKISDELYQSMIIDSVVHGYVIYRLLDRLILLDVDGYFYISGR